eukprot:scaffold30223_cov32-Phaeocystis_antarctica.AAC.1
MSQYSCETSSVSATSRYSGSATRYSCRGSAWAATTPCLRLPWARPVRRARAGRARRAASARRS